MTRNFSCYYVCDSVCFTLGNYFESTFEYSNLQVILAAVSNNNVLEINILFTLMCRSMPLMSCINLSFYSSQTFLHFFWETIHSRKQERTFQTRIPMSSTSSKLLARDRLNYDPHLPAPRLMIIVQNQIFAENVHRYRRIQYNC